MYSVGNRLPEGVARKFTIQLVNALDHMHKQGLAYRSHISTDGVLIGDGDGDEDGDGDLCLKLSDFRLAQESEEFEIDFWNLALIVYEMLTGTNP